MRKGLLLLCLVLAAWPLGAMGSSPQAYIEAGDAEGLARDYLLPFLERDDRVALVFGAELNLSNGDPYTRDYGERGMFGRLVTAAYVLEHFEELSIMRETVLEETRRLLFGPWQHDGGTVFSFARRYNVRLLDYETGKWQRVKYVPTLRIEHYTEYTGKKRVAHIAYQLAEDAGDEGICFAIAHT